MLPHASRHTDTHTHTTRCPSSFVCPPSFVLSSVASPCCSSHESSRPIVFQPLSPVVHASLIQSTENLAKTLQFRRTPSSTYLLVDIRLTPVCSHSSQTPKHHVAGRQPSTLRSFSEWFNARNAHFFVIPWVVCWREKRGGRG